MDFDIVDFGAIRGGQTLATATIAFAGNSLTAMRRVVSRTSEVKPAAIIGAKASGGREI